MTFSEYIIDEYSLKFYALSLLDISKSNSTLEDWFNNLYYDYKLLNDPLFILNVQKGSKIILKNTDGLCDEPQEKRMFFFRKNSYIKRFAF